MFSFMRTHQRTLWLVITVLTIIAFVFLYDYTDRSHAPGTGTVAQIYGRDLSVGDFQREARKFDLALALGLTEYVAALGGNGSEEGYAEYVVNNRVLDHEGRKLGIQPGDEEIKNAILALPAFQTGGQFDPKRYQELVTTRLAPQGFTELEIQKLIQSSLVLKRLQQTLDAAPAITPAEEAYVSRIFQPITGVAILFDRAEFAKAIKPTEKEIEAAFKAGSARFVTPEYRVARYVAFPLPADAQKLEGKARMEAQQKIADASDAFANQAAGEGFEKAAQAAGLKVETTLPFDRNGQIQMLADLQKSLDSAAAIGGVTTAIAPTAFTLTEKAPISGVLQNGDGFLVAELTKVIPSRPLTLDEARPEIVAELTETAAAAALDKSAADALAKLRAAAKAGQSAASATAAAGLKTEPFTNLLLTDEAAPVEQRRFADTALVLGEGEISGLRADPTGAYAVWLEKRGAIDSKAAEAHRDQLMAGILAQRQRVLFAEWLKSAREAAGVTFASSDRG